MKSRNCLVLLLLVVMVLLPLAGCAAPTATPLSPTKAPAAAPTAMPPTSAPATKAAAPTTAAAAQPTTAASAAPAVKPTTAPTAVPTVKPTVVVPAGSVKVTYWRALTGVPGDLQDELAAKFNASQKGIVVDSQFQGAYAEVVQKLQAGLAAGEVPDLVLLDSPFVALFAKDGVLAPLDGFAKDSAKGLDLNQFIPGLIADGYYDGKLYALPFMRSTPLLYYNRDMFKEVGLPDRAPETWAEFKEFCAKLAKVEDGKTTRFCASFTMGLTTAHWYLQEAIYAFGGEVTDEKFNTYLTKPEAMAAAQLWQDLVFKEKTATAADNPQTDFLNQRVGMVFGSTGSMANLMTQAKFPLGFGFMPAQVKRQVPVGGSMIAMTSTDKARQAAAWEFLKWVTSPENNAIVVEKTGYVPTSQAAMDVPSLKAYFEKYPERKVAVDQLKYARPQGSFMSLGKGSEILRAAVEQLLVANRPVDQVMADAEKAIKKEYAETWK